MVKCSRCHQEFPNNEEFFYFTKSGPRAGKRASNICRSCKLAADNARHKTPEGREKARAAVKRWKENHPEKAAAQWQSPQKKAYNARYKKTDAGRLSAVNYSHKRRTQMKDTDITKEWLMELKEKTILCPYCGSWVSDNMKLHLDHVQPLSLGGKHMMANVVFVCGPCNLYKGADDYSEWRY